MFRSNFRSPERAVAHSTARAIIIRVGKKKTQQIRPLQYRRRATIRNARRRRRFSDWKSISRRIHCVLLRLLLHREN